ncbi:MAG: hypothetical protein E7598_00415 [Ruminococcaceae bacterium]|nr:hypothetical protein [Oscillospiraceae bacterium]
MDNVKKVHTTLRLAAIAALFIVICAVYLVVLVRLQITGQDYYTIIEQESKTRYISIDAARGEIYDRNGKALVVNTTNYSISLEYGAMPRSNAEFNAVILDTRAAVKNGGGESCLTEPVFPFKGSYPNYIRDGEFFASATNRTKFASLLRRLELDEDTTDKELFDYLRSRYGIAKITRSETVENYSEEEADRLFRTRFHMEYMQFSRVEPYTIAEDVPLSTLTYVKELAIHQVMVTEKEARTYVYDGYASHILGHIAKIPAEELAAYTEKGYPGDAYVGRSGMEKVCEEYLRGENGVLEIVEDAYGNIISEKVIKEPVPGKDVYLTIDIDLQISAEKALADNIKVIRERAKNEKGDHDGEDASCGAAVAVDPYTGEVLALASYPTFNLSDYLENYSLYSADEKRPLYNRATLGTYTPGSTFKPGVAAAALDAGVITVNTTVYDGGFYAFSADYNPRCWYYLRYNRGHGSQNVVQAIQNSCNVFFYDVGNRLGIEKMNEYIKKFGLGEPTGIEIGESSGILAGPAYSESRGNIWVPGNTLQAAIGQSDNMFSPLQLAVYTSALINGGTRYKAHLLRKVTEFPSGTVVHENTSEIIAKVELRDGILQTIKSAMKDVVESGSAARIFRGYDIAVGGKTGTAQVGGDRSDNALFIGFAPYSAPKIAVAVVIEQGANGTDAAYTAKAMYDSFLKGEQYVSQYNEMEVLP